MRTRIKKHHIKKAAHVALAVAALTGVVHHPAPPKHVSPPSQVVVVPGVKVTPLPSDYRPILPPRIVPQIPDEVIFPDPPVCGPTDPDPC